MTQNTEKVVLTNLTPDAAQRLLANNTFNRPLRQKRINKLARTVLDGRWKFNGASIVVDKRGCLLDGQHRCHAVIRANKAIRTVLVTGVSPKVFNTIDQGAKRTGADIFNLCGVSNPSEVASSLTIVYQHRNDITEGSEGGNVVPDMDERTALFDSIAAYEELVRDVCHYKKNLVHVFSMPMLAGLYFLFQEKHKRAAQRFLAAFAGTHEGGSLKNPARIARLKFKDLAEQDYRIGRQSKCAYLKIAWNCYAAGKQIDDLTLPPTLDIPINKLSSHYWLENE